MKYLKKIFRVLNHYSHAFEIRSLLSCEYMRLRKLNPSYPRGLLKEIWSHPQRMEHLIQLSRFMAINEKILLIDIGGNTGYWAQEFIYIFPKTSIVAFEPDKRAAKKYRERFNGKSDVTLHEVALSDNSGSAKLMMTTSSTFSSLEQYTLETKGKSEAVDSIEVKKIPLNDVEVNTDGFDKVFVKIDVQGHEVPVVRGGGKLLERADIVLVELSFASEYDGLPPSFMLVASILQRSGHYPIIFQDYGRTHSPYAWERDVIFVKEEFLEQIWGW